MAELSIQQATVSNQAGIVSEYSVAQMQTDSATGQEETEWCNVEWGKQWGIFNTAEELHSAILGKCVWIVGKGWTADAETKVILDHISGMGKDTFDEVLFNMCVISLVGGDAYAEIIREKGVLINLKPLDPSTIRIVVDGKGLLKRYEQISKVGKNITFKPEEIFHLSHNRLADQIHGISVVKILENMILTEGESFADLKKVFHRQARPMIMFKINSDNKTVIDAFISKMDNATAKGENIYIPDDKNNVSFQVVQVDVSPSTLAWRDEIRRKFYRIINMPLVVFGQSGGTESGSKMEYLSHEQYFAKDQRFLELQIWNQLNIKIKLIPPTSLLENLQTDEAKDANQGMEIQPQDVTAGKGE